MRTDLGHRTLGTPNPETDDRMSSSSPLAHQAVTAVPKLVISDRLPDRGRSQHGSRTGFPAGPSRSEPSPS